MTLALVGATFWGMDKFIHDRLREPVDDAGWAAPETLLHWISVPRLALKLTRACHLPHTGYDQLCNWLQYDPALLCRYLFVLRDQPGSTTPVTIRERLQQGDRTLLSRTLLCAPRLDDQFPESGLIAAEQWLLQHWLESVQCAFLSRAFARLLELPDCDDVFFGGLLYRCGELALFALEKQDYLHKVLTQATPQLQREQERRLFQVTAPMISQRILRQLQLPQAYQDAALFHELPTQRILAAHPVTRVVYVSHQIVSGQIGTYADASRLCRQLLGLSGNRCEMLLESALTQAFDVVELLGLPISPDTVRQRLLPPPPQEDVTSTLMADLHQLRLERTQIKNILSATLWLQEDSNPSALLQQVQRAAYLLFGSRQVLLFRHNARQRCLQGENPALHNAFEAAVSIALEHSTLVTDCFRLQQAVASFSRPEAELSVIDLELMQLCQCQSLVALPVSLEHQQWGCLVLAFDNEIQTRFNRWHDALLFFAQQVHQGLALQDTRRRWQQEMVQFERRLFENRLKRLAHEINNPLSIAQNHLHILGTHLDDQPDMTEQLGMAIDQIHGSSQILQAAVERLNGHSTPLTAVSINELIQDVLYVFSSQEALALKIMTTLDERLPTLYIDENYARQVLINLIKNAMECCDEGNTIHVTTRGQINIHGQRHIAIQIQDDGPGLADSLLDTLFVEQHSEKPGADHGLGLTIVKDLVEEMGGLIFFQRSEDHLSIFTVYLPVTPQRTGT